METPPPYTPSPHRPQPAEDDNGSRMVKMSSGRLAILLIGCVVGGMMCSLGLWYLVLGDYYERVYIPVIETVTNPRRLPEQKAGSTQEPSKTKPGHYVADREISFEMNAGTGFVRIPANDIWVRKYDIRKFRTRMPSDSVIAVSDGHYRFSADVGELRRQCGDGAKPMPIKWTLTDMTCNRDKPFHITTLLVQYREDGTADVQVAGYIFDK